MTDDTALLIDVTDGVGVLTLNRPAQRNALSPELVVRLAEAWERMEADDEVRVVVLTGNGPVFCAGADLRLLIPLMGGTRQPADDWDHRLLAERDLAGRATLRTRVCTKPIIAACAGATTAGGFELMLACDLRVAGTEATFGLAEVKRGLIPGGGGVARLPRQVPLAQAMEILLTGEVVAAERALAMGLVNRVVPSEAVLDTAVELARVIAANGPFAVRAIVRAVSTGQDVGLDEALGIEARTFAEVMATDDATEGPLAFMEKRPPRFTGR